MSEIPPTEREIRAVLISKLQSSTHRPDSWISELGVAGGRARADLVRLDSRIEAYEIKSNSDSLKRLARQAWFYSKAFDEVSLVADRKHLRLAEEILPAWWGIWEVSSESPLQLSLRRKPSQSPWQEGLFLASLLSRNELEQVLIDLDKDLEPRSSSLRELWSIANHCAPLDHLRTAVIDRLVARTEIDDAVTA